MELNRSNLNQIERVYKIYGGGWGRWGTSVLFQNVMLYCENSVDPDELASNEAS